MIRCCSAPVFVFQGGCANVASIAILDDEIFDYEEIGLLGYLSLTDFDEGGLKKMHVRKAIATLQRQGPSL